MLLVIEGEPFNALKGRAVLMFLYMEVASKVKRRAFDGIFVGQVPFLS